MTASNDRGAPHRNAPDGETTTVDHAPPARGPGSDSDRTDAWATRFWPLVVGVVVLALVIRLAAFTLVGHPSGFDAPVGDGLYYLFSSEVLVQDGEFGTRGIDGSVTADVLHPPLWQLYLAFARAAGADTISWLRAAAGLLGLATVVLVALAGRRMLSARAGILAAAVVATSPAFWTYERNLNAEAITFPLIAAVILLTYRYLDRRTLGRYAALAAAFGLLALARSEQAIVGAILLVVLVWSTRSIDVVHRLLRLALAGVIVLAITMPWTIFNLSRFEHPVLLSAGAGNAMLAGSCDLVFAGDDKGGFDPACILKQPDILWSSDRTVSDRRQREIATEYTLDHLGELPGVVVAREGRAWAFYDVGDQNATHAAALGIAPSWIWIQTILFWLLVPLAVLGVVLLRRAGIAVYPLLVFPAVAAVSVAITFGDIRYRAAAEIPLVLLAAAGVDLVLRRRRRQPTTGRAPEVAAAGQTR